MRLYDAFNESVSFYCEYIGKHRSVWIIVLLLNSPNNCEKNVPPHRKHVAALAYLAKFKYLTAQLFSCVSHDRRVHHQTQCNILR